MLQQTKPLDWPQPTGTLPRGLTGISKWVLASGAEAVFGPATREIISDVSDLLSLQSPATTTTELPAPRGLRRRLAPPYPLLRRRRVHTWPLPGLFQLVSVGPARDGDTAVGVGVLGRLREHLGEAALGAKAAVLKKLGEGPQHAKARGRRGGVKKAATRGRPRGLPRPV